MLLAIVVGVLLDMEDMEDTKHMVDMEDTEDMMEKMETNTYSQHSLCTLLNHNWRLKAVASNDTVIFCTLGT